MMDATRWLVTGIGIVLVAAVNAYFLGRRRARRARADGGLRGTIVGK